MRKGFATQSPGCHSPECRALVTHMKHRLLGSLTVALVASSFGATLPSHAQQLDELEPSSPPLSDSSTLSPNEAEETASSNATSLELSYSSLDLSEDFVTIYPHPFDDRQAATLYVDGIPVLTFVGDELNTLGGSKELVDDDASSTEVDVEDPVARARQAAARIEEFHRQNEDAARVSARWQADEEVFSVVLGDVELVRVDEHTILPDTTGDISEDSLHVANRLRRLLGDAPPLIQVEGLPNRTVGTHLAVRSMLTGIASWYGPGFHGRRSASGEVFNRHALTAAHRTLPFGTQVRVTNLNTQQQVVVRINDRGPFWHGRIIDLSEEAARQIGLTRRGVGPVHIEVLTAP